MVRTNRAGRKARLPSDLIKIATLAFAVQFCGYMFSALPLYPSFYDDYACNRVEMRRFASTISFFAWSEKSLKLLFQKFFWNRHVIPALAGESKIRLGRSGRPFPGHFLGILGFCRAKHVYGKKFCQKPWAGMAKVRYLVPCCARTASSGIFGN